MYIDSAVLCCVVKLISEFDEMSQSSDDDDADDDSGKETKNDEGSYDLISIFCL